MPAHMPSTATPVRYEFKAKSLWTKVDKVQPLKNLARRFAVAVRLYSRGVGVLRSVWGALPSVAQTVTKKTKRKRRAVVGAPSGCCLFGFMRWRLQVLFCVRGILCNIPRCACFYALFSSFR